MRDVCFFPPFKQCLFKIENEREREREREESERVTEGAGQREREREREKERKKKNPRVTDRGNRREIVRERYSTR